MPTYTYRCPEHGEFEFMHSIKEQLDTCPLCLEDSKHSNSPCKVERLISGGGTFILNGSGWAKDNYG